MSTARGRSHCEGRMDSRLTSPCFHSTLYFFEIILTIFDFFFIIFELLNFFLSDFFSFHLLTNILHIVFITESDQRRCGLHESVD